MPEYHTWRNRLLTVPQMLLSLRTAARLIAVSQVTAQDLTRIPGIDAARIRIIPEAPSPGLVEADPDAIQRLRTRLNLPDIFFLFLGALEPRKNVASVVKALSRLYAAGDCRAHLVIAGAEGWRNADVSRAVRGLGLDHAVHFVGFVPQSELPALYGAAVALIYPSFFEGFGLPPLEAMVCGAPVVCSNVSSLPEVVGAAALMVDPRSVEQIAGAMCRLLEDPTLRESLRVAGRLRAAEFSWARSARDTLAVYRETVQRHPGNNR
jgi:glycosyltransferase involved in cell wall biosynthesis